MNSKSFNLKDVVLFEKSTGKAIYKADDVTLETSSVVVPKSHRIDFSKVNTIEDVKDIIDALNISFYEGSTQYEKVKHLMED